ncbi:hypothetical protein BH23ACT3_BH23ACT3_11660 [soil metagenome]
MESAIDRARGGGAPIESRVRSRFEGAMGTDLGGVRMHTDDSADKLSRAVSAKAFTTGNDVFFSKGSYDPHSSDGQHLLAHELTHTVQQQGSARRTSVQRMSVQGTDFSATTSVRVFSGGGSGNVALFSDGGTPIIVKVDQLIGHEVVVAGNLLSGANAADGASGGYQVKAPDSRIASPSEIQAIKAATLANLKPGDDPRNFVTGLDSKNPTIIAEKMSGSNMEDIIKNEAHGTKNSKGKTKANPDSILFQMVNKSGPLTSLGKAAVPDIMMGMRDRIVGAWNAQNFMYDETTKTFNFVDNTQNIDSGFVTTVELGGGYIHTSKAAFESWAGLPQIAQLTGDIPTLASAMFTTITGLNDFTGILGDFPNTKDPETFELLKAAIVKNQKKMTGYLASGLKDGLKTVTALLKNPLPLTTGVPAAKRLEVVQSLLAKSYVLAGKAPDAAWTQAGIDAAKMVPQAPPRPTTAPPQMPPLPATPSQGATQPGASGSTWQRGATPGRGNIKIGTRGR